MEKVYFHIQTSKKKGQINVRYRLTDGRAIQFSHKTDIKCELDDLAKFNVDGTTKPRVQLFNQQLSEKLKIEYRLMLDAYARMRDTGMDLTGEVFEKEIAQLRNPRDVKRVEAPKLVARFRKYTDDALRAGVLGVDRHKHIIVVSDKLERFLIINGISGITAEEFNIDHLMEFREFLFDEYLYIKKYPKLYEKVKAQNKPQARLSTNTVTSQLKMLQTFFTDLEYRDEIRKSPFRMMSKEKRKAFMKTKFSDPFFLRKEEFLAILNANVPAALKDTKDAFLVQCAFGCRISDFIPMTLDTISVSDDGIPYVHYIPKKTADAQDGNEEVETPVVRYAFDIIIRTGFVFPVLKNIYGKSGYNAKIRSLLQLCNIDRHIAQYNERTKCNDYLPLYKAGNNKLARKTHVDLMNKVQIDKYAAGLHKRGSSAVNRYTNLELKNKFDLMNLAFEQPSFTVNKELVIQTSGE